MSASCYDPTNPEQYQNRFVCDLNQEQNNIDDQYGEYLATYGRPVDIYIVVDNKPSPVFGEDPNKVYADEALVAFAWFEPTAEVQSFGQHGVNSQNEVIKLVLHRTTVREGIRRVLVNEGVADPSILDGGPNDFDAEFGDGDNALTNKERLRRDLVEGDIIRLRYNNIHYEVDDVALEPEYQPLLGKYVYQVTARPRMLSAEDIGDAMQPITHEEEVTVKNNVEIDTEANKIIF